MKLTRLLAAATDAAVADVFAPDPDCRISSLHYDSRLVEPDGLFFAVAGEVTDGHLYIDGALERGAAGVVSERPRPDGWRRAWVQVEAIRPAMAHLANAFWEHPSARLELVGITGTNGKTTTSFLAHGLLESQAPALLMGTVKTLAGGREAEARLTTPEAIDIQQHLHCGLEAGCRWGAMEVSSHALAFDRVLGSRFKVAVLTNLTQEHLDFHRDFEDYFAAKCLLFDRSSNPGLETALLNADDPWAVRVAVPEGVARTLYGFSDQADIRPLDCSTSVSGSRLEIQLPGRRLRLESSLIGRHNVYNLMAAVGAASACGLDDEAIARATPGLPQVPGRFERVAVDAPYTVVIDYAHTPDAFRNLFELAATLGAGRVLCLFGCGGDRDRVKRPQMAELAVRMTDWAVFTSDNPRHEDPEAILAEMTAGVPEGATSFETIVDREEAILRLLERAAPGDLILLVGKGHETYQAVGDDKTYFCEREIVQGAL